MPAIIRVRVVTPFLAIRQSTRSHCLVAVRAGAVIEMPESFGEPGLYTVRLGHETVFAFTRDLQERTERVDFLLIANVTDAAESCWKPGSDDVTPWRPKARASMMYANSRAS